ncbi:DUF3558 family protein [Actinoplanes sp. HUAS TT8]|uniref:DUF3558 family protein n=1 Tax=Actinoplanes sp. HUAS TT8 TaxID=3447453 RepID=UPI003F51CEDA
MSHTVVAGVSLLALLGAAAGCSSDTSTSADQPAAAGAPAAAKTKKTPAVDSCTLLKAAEVKDIIGANDGGQPGNGVGESVCTWENQDNYHSVTVSIGSPKTTLDGKVPVDEVAGPGEPGPDGIRFASDNTATYVIGDRVCYVQVVTDPTSNKDRDIDIRLIKLIRARTAGKL